MSPVGILALQGGFSAHAKALERIGLEAVEVRYQEQMDVIDGLILPGGESSTNLLLIERFGLRGALESFKAGGKPILATCAGLILIAATVTHPEQQSLGWIDITVARNGWGRQVDSFEAVADDGQTPLMFIRAPRITRLGDDVEVLLELQGEPILVRQNNVTGATFHPELTKDSSIHASVFGTNTVTGSGKHVSKKLERQGDVL